MLQYPQGVTVTLGYDSNMYLRIRRLDRFVARSTRFAENGAVPIPQSLPVRKAVQQKSNDFSTLVGFVPCTALFADLGLPGSKQGKRLRRDLTIRSNECLVDSHFPTEMLPFSEVTFFRNSSGMIAVTIALFPVCCI